VIYDTLLVVYCYIAAFACEKVKEYIKIAPK